jgi:thioredoxin 1
MTIHQANDLAHIINTSKQNPGNLVVVDCGATWCGPCRGIHPVVEQLSNSNPHVIFMEVDADDSEHADTMKTFGVKALPTFLYFRGGNLIKKTEGANQQELINNVSSL